MAAYTAIIFKDEDGGFYAEVPDLPGCITQGNTLEELDAMLKDALSSWLEVATAEGEKAPAPRDPEEVRDEACENDDFYSTVLVTIPNKPKRTRINVSLTETDLRLVDNIAAKLGKDRSELLVFGAKELGRAR